MITTLTAMIVIVLCLVSIMEASIIAIDRQRGGVILRTNGGGKIIGIGVANRLTLTRIACAPIIFYIMAAAAQPFGEWSYVVGASSALIAIATDFLDGFLARKLRQETKVGEVLDMLADKIIFYFCLVGLWSASGHNLSIIFADNILVGFLILHDLACTVGYFVLRSKYPAILGQLKTVLVDRFRFALSSAWLIVAMFALSFPSSLSGLALVLLLIAGLLSLFALYHLFVRVRNAHEATKIV